MIAKTIERLVKGRHLHLGLVAMIFVAVLATGALFAWWTVSEADRTMRDDLIQEALIIAKAVNIEDVKSLSGTREDTRKPGYSRLKEQLSAICSANPECRFIYLLGRKVDGTIFFLVDSEASSSAGYSPPGQPFNEPTPECLSVFERKIRIVEGPTSDAWGTWVSGLIPLVDRTNGKLIAVLGMDIDASTWYRNVAKRAALPAGLMLFLLLAVAVAVTALRWLQIIQAQKAAIEERETSYSNQFAKNSIPMLLIDPQSGEIIDANKAAALYFSYSRERLQTMRISQISTRPIVEIQQDMLSIRPEQGKLVLSQHRLADGSLRDVEVSASNIQFGKRRLLHAIIFDITERTRTEKTLRIQHELSLAMGSIDDVHKAAQQILSAMLHLDHIDCGGFYLEDRDDNFELLAHHGLSPQFIANASHYTADPEQTRMILSGVAYYGAYSTHNPALREEGLRGLAILPIRHQGKLLALINLFSRTQDDIPFYIRHALETLAQQTGNILVRLNADRALRESEAKHRTFINATSDLVFLKDQNCRYLLINKFYEAFLGKTEREIVGKSDFDLMPPDMAALCHESDLNALAQGGMVVSQEPVGDRVYEVQKFPVMLQSGQTGIGAFIRDITDRLHAQEDLKRIEAYYRDVVESQSDMIARFSGDGRITFCNRAYIAYYRKHLDDTGNFIGKAIRDIMVVKNYEVMMAFLNALKPGDSPDPIERSFVSRSGEMRWQSWKVHRIDNGRDGQAEFQVVGTDITDRKRAEEALQESEKRFRTLAENSLDTIMRFDRQHRHLYVNAIVEKATGVKPEAFIGKTHSEMGFPPELCERWGAAIEKVFQSGKLNRIEFQLPNGNWLDWLLAPEKDNTGQVIAVVASARDITARKRTDEALKDSEARFRSVVESSPMGMHFYQLDGDDSLVFVGANPAADRIVGVDHRQFIGKTIEEAFPNLVATEIPERYRSVAKHGTFWQQVPFSYEEGKIKGNFEIYAFQTSPNAMSVLFTDITEKLVAQENIRQSEQRFRDMAEQLDDVLFFTDMEGRITYISPAVERLFGWLPDEMNGHYFVNFLEENQVAIALTKFEETIRTGQRTKQFALTMRKKDGRSFIGEVSASIAWKGKQNIGTLGLIRDITERRLAEEEKAKLEEQLQQAMKMEAVGRLAGGVAHDFNNQLTGISGFVSLALARLRPEDPLTEMLLQVKKAAESSAALTRQLLAFSRKQLIEPKVVDLNEIISATHKMLVRLIGEDISLTTIQGKDLGSVLVDPGQFEQILVNLAVNARDAMPGGGKLLIETANIELSEAYCASHPQSKPGQYVMLAVSDTGHGMTEATRKHLFEPFFTTKSKGHGTGLGLATTYGALKQAGGSIEVYSEEGQGSTFRIYLPRVAEKAESIRNEQRDFKALSGHETVLLVEDETIVRELAVAILNSLGYRVLNTNDGPTACAVAEKYAERIDLLFTDVVMPGMNGRQLAERLIKIHPEMKVLYSSGYTENAIAHHGIIDQGLSFISKPYTPQALAKKLREVLEN